MKKSPGASGKVCPVHCDLRRESDILDMFQLIRNKYGRIDACINNAGMSLKQETLWEGDTEEWREMLNVSVFRLCHLCTKPKVKLKKRYRASTPYRRNVCLRH